MLFSYLEVQRQLLILLLVGFFFGLALKQRLLRRCPAAAPPGRPWRTGRARAPAIDRVPPGKAFERRAASSGSVRRPLTPVFALHARHRRSLLVLLAGLLDLLVQHTPGWRRGPGRSLEIHCHPSPLVYRKKRARFNTVLTNFRMCGFCRDRRMINPSRAGVN